MWTIFISSFHDLILLFPIIHAIIWQIIDEQYVVEHTLNFLFLWETAYFLNLFITYKITGYFWGMTCTICYYTIVIH